MLVVAAASGLIWKLGMDEKPTEIERETTIHDVVPVPASVEPADGVTFTLTDKSEIRTIAGSASAATEVGGIAEYLAGLLRPVTSYLLPIHPSAAGTTAAPAEGGTGGHIALALTGAEKDLGAEGYVLEVTAGAISLRANAAAGLFRGVQTLRQLLPTPLEIGTVQPGPWTVPGGRIVDQPRFSYRGIMLDVARHFFAVSDVKRVIELAALYKINYLHLHLTDDQGWRIAVDAWPRLASFGGGSEVGGGPGGHYTKDDYREIVSYASRHFMTVVPEVDLPGHTNAALASYPELNCDGQAPARYTGIDVGFSSLCVDKDVTYRFLDDVFGELAEMTPGPYLHIGGDEAKTLTADDYAAIVNRAQEIVGAHGKTVVGWHEVAGAKLTPSTVVQFWGVTPEALEVLAAAAQGNRIIMSPANRAYLDMKYDSTSPIGLSWAGNISVAHAYDWDPMGYLLGLDPAAVLGVESPLWTETVRTIDDIEYLAFPRLVATAELAWSPASTHDWDRFSERLGAQAPRWAALGVNFYRSPEVPWVVER